jgi:hypothetical protein
MKYLMILVGLVPFMSFASSFTLELAQVRSQYNYFQKPNNDVDRVDLPDKTLTGGRLYGRMALNERWDVSFLYAPLETSYNLTSRSNFNFNGTAFSQNAATKVRYKFNSYRVGFLRKYTQGAWRFVVGPVLKVRDARLAVTQSAASSSFSNVGPVPLLGIGAEYVFSESLSALIYSDALAGGPGYAYDVNAEVRYSWNQSQVGVGYRTLGGGADNDELKNFARFNAWTLSYTFKGASLL